MNNEAEPPPPSSSPSSPSLPATSSSGAAAVPTAETISARRSQSRGGGGGRRGRNNSHSQHHHRTSHHNQHHLLTTKLHFLTQLLRALDALTYYHITTTYFLDTSFPRFLLRLAIQLNFLTPKPAHLPTPPPTQTRSLIYALFGTTLFCLLCHILYPEPSSPGDPAGYLHGGLLLDFVGQQGPVSKVRLVAMDVVIWGLQVLMMAVGLEKKEVLRRKGGGGDGGGSVTGDIGDAATGVAGTNTARIQSIVQDLDNEEQGRLADQEDEEVIDDDDDDDSEEEEEAEPTNTSSSSSSTEEPGSLLSSQEESDSGGGGGVGRDAHHREPLLPSQQAQRQQRQRRRRRRQRQRQRHSRNSADSPGGSEDDSRYNAYSGQLVIANVRLFDAIRMQWNHGNLAGTTSSRAAMETSPLRRRNTARDAALSVLVRFNRQRQTGGF